jgi:hypothetical protein
MNDQQTEAVTERTPTAMPKHPIVRLAHRFGLAHNDTAEQLVKTLSATIMPKGRNVPAPSFEELTAFCLVALEYDLNPWLKEIYAFPKKGGGIAPIVGVDGWVTLANRHPQFDGMEFSYEDDEKGNPVSVGVTIHRKDRSHPTSLREYYKECRRDTEPWRMARRMLRHRALCQGVRVAFGVSGIYSPDEAEDFTARVPEWEETAPRKEMAISDLVSTEEESTEDDGMVIEPEPATEANAKTDDPASEDQIRALRKTYEAGVTAKLWTAKTFLSGTVAGALGLILEVSTLDHAWQAIAESVPAERIVALLESMQDDLDDAGTSR